MKLSILIDNNTISGSCFGGEAGFSCWIEIDGKKILMDMGRTDMFLKNAARLGIDCLDADYIILSHGHYDHTWGLHHLVQAHIEATYEKRPCRQSQVIAHVDAFLPKEAGHKNIGMLMSRETLQETFPVTVTRDPMWLTKQLVFLAEVERSNDFEAVKSLGHTRRYDTWEDDYLYDDSALVYTSPKGLVIITACAHAGICNTIAYARKVCHEDRVHAIIGGFHLLRDDPAVMEKTLAYMTACQPDLVYPCHCVSLENKVKLAAALPVKELGAGTVLSFE
ncbi:MAG: MBL fold metallo-hydrolase [Megasphaera sp.]|jgi:7,8-dihydropterin-6-yl-methyl-4-(beta-D-ribofuranosyl)aminobenzene 5'-phosphate synthase|nr:MBL fold metallo-hydrolase [Megasphaera sp.]MCH4188176.1 MBL fold metallo-hydrolase [Megasphaera sp.]MCH4217922.1 MBL fold metallo-hydrolase [Megasphaera sp.]